jgi:hypothetical protein
MPPHTEKCFVGSRNVPGASERRSRHEKKAKDPRVM